MPCAEDDGCWEGGATAKISLTAGDIPRSKEVWFSFSSYSQSGCMTEQIFQEQLRHFEQICKDAGLKLTHQRTGDLYGSAAVAGPSFGGGPVQAAGRKKLPTLSLDTVYRTLATFEKTGDWCTGWKPWPARARYEALGGAAPPFSLRWMRPGL